MLQAREANAINKGMWRHFEGISTVLLEVSRLIRIVGRQEQGKTKEALETICGPLGDAVALPEERRLLTASLTVCCLTQLRTLVSY